MPKPQILAASLVGAFASAIVPVAALITLAPADYGAFSFAYLIFAFAWSLQLSIVCDAWARTRASPDLPGEWRDYWPAVCQLSVFGGLITGGATAAIFNDPVIAVILAAAVSLNLYRLGGRFYFSALGHGKTPVFSDAAAFAGFLLCILASQFTTADVLFTIAGSWLVSSLAGALMFLPVKSSSGAGLWSWYVHRKAVVHTLLGDSILMDIGANAVPAALAPLMGPQNFGVYRGISSVATPVQLILDPLRPTLAQLPLAALAGRRYLAGVVGIAGILAVSCFVILAEIIPRTTLAQSTLGALSQFALACSLFVAVNFFGHFYYIASRNYLPRRELFVGRILHTAAAIAGPFLGLAVAGLPGAIWGFVTASTLSSMVWFVLIQLVSRKRSVSAALAN